MYYQHISEGEFPSGVRCSECDRELSSGQPYVTRLEDMAGDTPITVICCVYC